MPLGATDHFVVKPIAVKEVGYSRPNIIVIVIILIQTQSCEYVHEKKQQHKWTMRKYLRTIYIYIYERAIDWLCQSIECGRRKELRCGRVFLHVCLAFAFMTWAFVVPTHVWAYTNSDTHTHTHVYSTLCIILCSYDLLLFWFCYQNIGRLDKYAKRERKK